MAINSVFNSLLNSTEVISLWLYAWNNMVQFLYFVMAFYNIRELLHSKRSNVDYEVHMSSFRFSYPCYLIVLLFFTYISCPIVVAFLLHDGFQGMFVWFTSDFRSSRNVFSVMVLGIRLNFPLFAANALGLMWETRKTKIRWHIWLHIFML